MILGEAQRSDVYKFGSGMAWRIRDFLKKLTAESTVKEIELQQQESRIRSHVIPLILCDASKLEKEMDWKPEIPIRQTLQDLLDHWR